MRRHDRSCPPHHLDEREPVQRGERATAATLADTFRHQRERYCALLERLANRVVPLREQRWAWIPRTDSPGQPWRQLVQVAAPTDEFSAPTKLAGQRGISSGAIEHIHFQEKEVLCRHLIEVVVEKVAEYQAEVGTG